MDIVFRSNDGKEFPTEEQCLLYESRLALIVERLIEVGLVEAVQGSWIANEIGVDRQFLSKISLMDSTLEIITRRVGAQHLAEFMDCYIALGNWLQGIQVDQSCDEHH